jgi:hypothetical protein
LRLRLSEMARMTAKIAFSKERWSADWVSLIEEIYNENK